MRLSTQLSLLTTLLTVLMTAVFALIAIIFFDASPFVLALIIPIACLTFILSFIIAYFSTQSFRDLTTMVDKYLEGDKSIRFSMPDSTYEVTEISENLEYFATLSEKRLDELTLLKKRQSEFISDVAHEFRTPLTAISGNTEIIMDPDMPQDMREHFCEIILSETERLKKLTNSLLALQNIKRDNPAELFTRVDVKDLANNVIDTLAPLAQERNITLCVEGEAPDVLVNADRLKQALINLIDNALRHVEDGGVIKIMLSGLNDTTFIGVKDNGCGIGDIDPQLLFKRFYRADASRARNTGGSGLGLAIVKEIVEANDGSITAGNAPEGGAIFLMAFPSVH